MTDVPNDTPAAPARDRKQEGRAEAAASASTTLSRPAPGLQDRGSAVTLTGDWTLGHADTLDALCAAVPDRRGEIRVDMSGVAGMDTAGGWFVSRLSQRLTEAGASVTLAGATGLQADLIDTIAAQRPGYDEPVRDEPPVVSRFGQVVLDIVDETLRLLAFFGAFIAACGRLVLRPRDIRLTSILHHVDHAGLRAVPIVALISLLIGAILTQQGIFQLKLFGAEQFAVDLTGILILREVGILLTAIMVAGRSGSAMTAEIGSMKMREEIDALRVLGLDPLEVLLVPRVIALIIALPLLGVVSGASGLVGAALTSWIAAGVTPVAFIERLREAVDFTTISAGLFKAPAMALVIGLTACIEGLRVGGSAESLGKHVTDAVVKAIFLVIVMDAIFALFYTAIDW